VGLLQAFRIGFDVIGFMLVVFCPVIIQLIRVIVVSLIVWMYSSE
jgi:hypothetical protein